MPSLSQVYNHDEAYHIYRSSSLHPPFPPNAPIPPAPTTTTPPSFNTKLHKLYHANKSFGLVGGKNVLQKIEDDQLANERKNNIYFPCADETEWELVEFLSMSSLSQAEINEFLKLRYVSRLTGTFDWLSLKIRTGPEESDQSQVSSRFAQSNRMVTQGS